MGANDDKNGKKNGKPEDADLEQVELTEKQQQLFEDALGTLRGLVDDIVEEGAPIREWALGLTKIEEAEMWIERGFDLLGIEPDIGDDDEDDDADGEGDDDADGDDGASQDGA